MSEESAETAEVAEESEAEVDADFGDQVESAETAETEAAEGDDKSPKTIAESAGADEEDTVSEPVEDAPAGDRIQNDGSPMARDFSTGRRDADHQSPRLWSVIQISDDRNVLANAKQLPCRTARIRSVKDCDHFFLSIPQ